MSVTGTIKVNVAGTSGSSNFQELYPTTNANQVEGLKDYVIKNNITFSEGSYIGSVYTAKNESLPASANEGDIYRVVSGTGTSASESYSIYKNGSWTSISPMGMGSYVENKIDTSITTALNTFTEGTYRGKVANMAALNAITSPQEGDVYKNLEDGKYYIYTSGAWVETEVVDTIGELKASAGLAMPIPTQYGTLTYNGSSQTPAWNNFNTTRMSISGSTSGTNAGTYTVTFSLGEGYRWIDGTDTDKTATWEIDKQPIAVPSVTGTSATYSGSAYSPTVDAFDSNEITKSGTSSATNAGTYSIAFTPKANYCWLDGSTNTETFDWYILRQEIIYEPVQSGTLTYNGSAQQPSWSNYDSKQLDYAAGSGTSAGTSGINAGTYTVEFTPTANYCWSQGGTSANPKTWTIQRQPILAYPVQSGTLTYNGSAQQPSWSNYDSKKLTITQGTGTNGATSATNAGTYTVLFTPTANYCWADSLG